MSLHDRQPLRVGLAILASSLALFFLPLLTGAQIGRFIVVLAFIGFLLGLSVIVHGMLDRRRNR